MSKSKFIDLTGQKLNLLKVLCRDLKKEKEHKERTGKTVKFWACLCECGNNTSLPTYRLIGSGVTTKSCGCLTKKGKPPYRKLNKYDTSGGYGIGYSSNTNEEFYFDLDDYEKIKQYTWMKNGQGYIQTNAKNEDGGRYRLHKLIMDANRDVLIDHINHKKNDNRKENLRIANKQLNTVNRGRPKDNKSGAKGVLNYGNRFISRIHKDGKCYYLGIHDTIQKAKEVYNKKSYEFFGEFTYDDDKYE